MDNISVILLLAGTALVGYAFISSPAISFIQNGETPQALFSLGTDFGNGIDMTAAIQIAEQNIIAREGTKYIVYRDSNGYLTGGIGHKITASDNLVEGHQISQATIDAWFYSDIQSAANAAINQAQDIGNTDINFVASLIAVNYQLGVNWTSEFSTTYALLTTGNYSQAINNLLKSAWYKQTPVRVKDFVASIQNTFTGV